MPDEKRALHRALEERVVRGEGKSTVESRTQAFANEGVPAALGVLMDKVADRPTQVTDSDLQAAKASGLSEDELFELVVCAAVGKSTRLYDAGLAALAEATGEGTSDAS
ncbi:hypothetical protein [Kribbella solani]|uniref:hypothetical protein n=1 Tax=Kribbella solani TaxID=236067 RepID=UPI0029A5E6BF|nr:hypothetical protein [Kribbella solani]MDX2969191.1 hypothetical protein [Kribbella solani]